MKKFIAFCGLDCEICEARIATVKDDDELRKKVAQSWSELNHADIIPEMINCNGCRMSGVKTPYCDFLCDIRQCAIKKRVETCGQCVKLKSCEKVSKILNHSVDARRNIDI